MGERYSILNSYIVLIFVYFNKMFNFFFNFTTFPLTHSQRFFASFSLIFTRSSYDFVIFWIISTKCNTPSFSGPFQNIVSSACNKCLDSCSYLKHIHFVCVFFSYCLVWTINFKFDFPFNFDAKTRAQGLW